mmetsp:Transcript_31176/g.88405  ORF Transcript_31176/g.88405 Transcript_31176/m.88405 type:complete len:392 (+) Transcript_31176:278-1453(+)
MIDAACSVWTEIGTGVEDTIKGHPEPPCELLAGQWRALMERRRPMSAFHDEETARSVEMGTGQEETIASRPEAPALPPEREPASIPHPAMEMTNAVAATAASRHESSEGGAAKVMEPASLDMQTGDLAEARTGGDERAAAVSPRGKGNSCDETPVTLIPLGSRTEIHFGSTKMTLHSSPGAPSRDKSTSMGVSALPGGETDVNQTETGGETCKKAASISPLSSWSPSDTAMAVFCLLVMATTVAVAVAVPQQREHSISCLVGPLGAWLRYCLSTFNGSWKAHKWLPLGTLFANVGAAVLDTLLEGVMMQGNYQTGGAFSSSTGGLAIGVVIDGFSGSLSTVSSWAMEAYNLMQSQGAKVMRAYSYMLITIAISVVLGVVSYGPFVWSSVSI